jgi:UDP-MurNAc hydroxylase
VCCGDYRNRDWHVVGTDLDPTGVAIECSRFHLLTEPLFERDVAFLGSRHQLPRNNGLDTPGILDVDWAAVWHERLVIWT